MANPSSVLSSPHARRIRRQFAFISPALLVDWIVVLLLGFLSHYIERRYPYERPLEPYIGDLNYYYPVMKEQVPAGPGSKMEWITWYLPLAVIVIVAASKRSFHDIHHGVLGLAASRAIMRLTVEFLKTQVGRLRPSFFSRCDYDAVAKVCQGSFELVKDGRKSFPSGHSSTSFQGLFFLTLFLAGKNGAFALSTPYPRSTPFQSRFLRLSICISPLFLAAWVCLTRLQDHWHHPTDVMAGATIGSACALLSYTVYYKNPFFVQKGEEGDGEELKELGRPKDVYGAMEERGIQLGDDEVIEGEEQA
ncbi:hypothetical protein JCM5353_002814 [Sporobolomyces roseus]